MPCSFDSDRLKVLRHCDTSPVTSSLHDIKTTKHEHRYWKAQFGSMNYGNNLQHSMAQRRQLTQNSSKSFTKAGDGCNAQVNMTCCEQLKEREEGWLIFGLRAVESGTEVMCPSIPLSVGTYWWDVSLLFTVSLTRGPNPQAESPLCPCPHFHSQVDGYLRNLLWQFKGLVQPEMKKSVIILHTCRPIWFFFLWRILSKHYKSGPNNLCFELNVICH